MTIHYTIHEESNKSNIYFKFGRATECQHHKCLATECLDHECLVTECLLTECFVTECLGN